MGNIPLQSNEVALSEKGLDNGHCLNDFVTNCQYYANRR